MEVGCGGWVVDAGLWITDSEYLSMFSLHVSRTRLTLCICYLKIKYRAVLKETAVSVVRDIIQVILSIVPLIILVDLRASIPDDILSSETDVNYHGISQR